MSLISRLWRDHSRTVICLTSGIVISAASWLAWPDGGNAWDFWGGIGVLLLAFGLEGIVNIWTEKNKPEE